MTDTKTGEKVDQWRSKIERGLSASSPYSCDKTKLVLGKPEEYLGITQSAAWPYQVVGFGMRGYPAIWWQSTGTLAHLSPNQNKARSMALSKLYKQLETERSEMNASASLAEIGDVLRQFGRPFRSIVDAFMRHENRLYFERRRLVGNKTRKEEQFTRIAAETWLEVSFGLIPLFSDAVSLAETFARWEYETSDSPRLRDRMRARASDLVAFTTPESEQIFFNVSSKGNSTKTTEARAQYVVGLKGELRADFGSNDRLLELLGLEPRNLPLAVWEAIPWSWLVDYCTNVQQILQAGATITSRVDWIVLTEVLRTVNVSRCKSLPALSHPWGLKDWKETMPSSAEDRTVRMIRTTLNRSIPTSLGVPPLYLKSPLGDLKKVANLVSVVIAKSKDRRTWLS